MTYNVWHRTHWSSIKIASSLDTETAFDRVRKEAKDCASMANDGLGQSMIENTWNVKNGTIFFIKVETMTAEAGWVMDCYSAEPERAADSTTSD